MKRKENKVKACFVSLFPFLEPEFDDKSKAQLAQEIIIIKITVAICSCLSIFFGLRILSR
jgi:hypothetical protein